MARRDATRATRRMLVSRVRRLALGFALLAAALGIFVATGGLEPAVAAPLVGVDVTLAGTHVDASVSVPSPTPPAPSGTPTPSSPAGSGSSEASSGEAASTSTPTPSDEASSESATSSATTAPRPSTSSSGHGVEVSTPAVTVHAEAPTSTPSPTNVGKSATTDSTATSTPSSSVAGTTSDTATSTDGSSATSSSSSTTPTSSAGSPKRSGGSVTVHVNSHERARGAASGSHHSATTSRRHARGGSGTGTTGALGSTLAAAASTPLLASGQERAGGRAPTRTKQPATHASKAGRLPPIVTTITKIVGIVPLWIEALIGALVLLALAFAIRSRLAARRAKRLAHQRGKLLEDVGLLQSALLPLPPSTHGAISTSAACRPADGPAAGGDFYDVFGLEDGRLAVIVGDVCGHGRDALPSTALVRFTLRAYLEAGLTPRQALQTAGSVLERQLGDGFATAALLTFQPRDRTLSYACAGHPAPVIVGSETIAPVTVCSAPPVGGGPRTGTRETKVEIPGGARICIHTDGITEARVGSELYGGRRLRQAVAELEPGASASDLLDRVAAQTSARPDDMAACLLDVDGDERAPTIVLEELELDAAQTRGERAEQFLLACGVAPSEVEAILAAARLDAERDGRVLLRVRRAMTGAEVSLCAEGPTQLRVASLAEKATVGAGS